MPTSKGQSEVRLTTDLEAAEQSATEEPSNDRPFVIVVLGDFLGTADGVPRDHIGPLHNRQLLDIDRDNFDAILAGFRVRWEAMLGGLLGIHGSAHTCSASSPRLRGFSPRPNC